MKTVCVDFDGTIVPWGPLMGDKDPFPHAKETIQGLRVLGYRIVILTSRMSKEWLKDEYGPDDWKAARTDQWNYVAETLNRAEIPWDLITAEKVKADYYIDDRAVTYESWGKVCDFFKLAEAVPH